MAPNYLLVRIYLNNFCNYLKRYNSWLFRTPKVYNINEIINYNKREEGCLKRAPLTKTFLTNSLY